MNRKRLLALEQSGLPKLKYSILQKLSLDSIFVPNCFISVSVVTSGFIYRVGDQE